MTNTPMTPDEEFEYYAQPENQEPQGPARRRHASQLGTPVPVRFPPELLEQARRAADADDRSLSSWIRRAVEHELRRTALSLTRCADNVQLTLSSSRRWSA